LARDRFEQRNIRNAGYRLELEPRIDRDHVRVEVSRSQS
jgi:hypothetical protein